MFITGSVHRVLEEISEVLEGEDYVSAEAVDKLEYLLQVQWAISCHVPSIPVQLYQYI